MANDVLKLANECEESAQAWANEVDTRKLAAAALRQQESAIAELRAEVERWKQSAREGWRYAKECDDGRKEAEQRADTAEARLERAMGLLLVVRGRLLLADPSGDTSDIDAFLGEGK